MVTFTFSTLVFGTYAGVTPVEANWLSVVIAFIFATWIVCNMKRESIEIGEIPADDIEGIELAARLKEIAAEVAQQKADERQREIENAVLEIEALATSDETGFDELVSDVVERLQVEQAELAKMKAEQEQLHQVANDLSVEIYLNALDIQDVAAEHDVHVDLWFQGEAEPNQESVTQLELGEAVDAFKQEIKACQDELDQVQLTLEQAIAMGLLNSEKSGKLLYGGARKSRLALLAKQGYRIA